MSIHATSTKVYSGAQMLTKNGMATPSTDTSFWASFSNLTQVDNGNGWATFTRSITSDYSNIQTTTTSVDLVGNSTYTAIVEIQNCSINSGYIIFAQTSAASDAASAFTVVNGCDYTPSTYFMGVSLNGNSTSKYNVYTFTTKSSFARGLRYFIDAGTGAGSLDIRATILTGDHSSDWQNYCGDNYEPYVGTTPSPLVKGVSHVSTSKNLLNMQSGSNGEYFGTTSQKTYSGKNLLRPNNNSAEQGVSFVWNSDGTVTLNGTVTQAADMWIGNGNESADAFSIASGEKITSSYQIVSGTASSTDSWKLRTILNYNGSNHWGDLTGNTTFTANSTTGVRGTEILLLVGATFNNCTLKIQIEKSASATTFEPYVGGVPSPNPDYPQEIVTGKLASKNIFEASSSPAEVWQGSYTKITANSLKVKSTVNHPASTAYARVDITGLTPNTDYYFSYNYERTGGSVSGPTVGGIATRIDGGAISSVTVGGRTINTGPGTYIRFYFYVGKNTSITTSDEVTFSNIQLEKGSTATSFEPFFSPIELAQISGYQDKVYKSGGNWHIETRNSKMLLDGSQTWTVGTGTNAYWTALAGSNDYNPIQTTMSDQFVGIAYNDRGNTPPNIMYRDNQTLTIRNTSFASASAATSWFTSNPATVYYLLATPTDTTITDSATILWLNKYDTNALPHHKYVNTRRTTYVGASGLASAIDLYDGSYASTLPTYTNANDHHLTTANDGTYTVSLQNISAKIVSGTVTFSVFTNQRKIDFSWNGSATSTNVSVSLQADEYIKSIYAYIPQDADAGITLSQQLESGSLTDFEPYYNIVKIYAGDDLVFEDTSLTD